jgi:hypothetical protein
MIGIQDFAKSRQHSSELICAHIELQIIAMFAEVDHDGKSAAALRQESLSHHCQYWALLKTNRICLFCLRRKLEHVMKCGHAICDACICIFGVPMNGREYYYEVDSCILCQVQVSFQARLLPPTCRIRFISTDGGGSGAVIPLRYMDAFQHALNLPHPIQENFDFGIGTSSGWSRLHEGSVKVQMLKGL